MTFRRWIPTTLRYLLSSSSYYFFFGACKRCLCCFVVVCFLHTQTYSIRYPKYEEKERKEKPFSTSYILLLLFLLFFLCDSFGGNFFFLLLSNGFRLHLLDSFYFFIFIIFLGVIFGLWSMTQKHFIYFFSKYFL